jgi:large conductance mechanosensitive channel
LKNYKKFRQALEKPPTPAPPKGFVNEFKDFLSKNKIFGLAVAFVVALYVGVLVQSLVQNLLIPLIGLVIPGMTDLATYQVSLNNQVFGIGDFLVALITFILVTILVFIVIKIAKKWRIE